MTTTKMVLALVCALRSLYLAYGQDKYDQATFWMVIAIGLKL